MKKFLSLVLALVMTMSLVTISAGAADFTDDSKIEYTEAVEVMKALKVIDGYADGSFRPATELNRAQAAKIICNMVLGPTTAEALSASSAPFSDVPADHWAAGYITFCVKEGYVNGYADGSFRPTAPLTGYAFMKMLLTALGYDAEMEGYVGANWGVNVAKQAIGIGLDDGNDNFVGTKIVTREEACLYAFNTLQADMVRYGQKTTVSVNGAEVVVGGSDATKTGKTFAETYFENLKSTDTTDDFGRPATKWTIKSKEVGTYAKTPDLTYTEEVDTETVYEDLGEPTMADGKKAAHIVDGDSQADITMDDDDVDVGGNGVLTEVYTKEVKVYDDDGDFTGEYVVKVTVVEINTYIGEVVDVDTNDDDERYVVVDGLEYVTEEFEEDDMVLYTMTVDGDDEIQSMVLAEKETGKLSKRVGSKYTIDGEVYELSEKATVDGAVGVGDDVDFYVDAYGYIIKMDEAEDNTSVDNLAYVLNAGESRGEGWAKLLFADGNTKTVDTDEEYDELKGEVVSFKVDDGVYELEEKTNITNSSVAKFDKGDTKIGGARVDSKTVFVYMVETDDDVDYAAYTGFKKAPSFENGKIVGYKKDTVATIVFVEVKDSDLGSSSSDMIFLALQDDLDENEDEDNNWYDIQAIVDGEITTLSVLADKITLENGVMVLSKIVYNSDDMVKSLTEVTPEDELDVEDADCYVVTTCKKESNEVILLGGESYAYADDVKVFSVDDDEITKSSVSSIREDDDQNKHPYAEILFTLNDDGDVDTIVLVKE